MKYNVRTAVSTDPSWTRLNDSTWKRSIIAPDKHAIFLTMVVEEHQGKYRWVLWQCLGLPDQTFINAGFATHDNPASARLEAEEWFSGLGRAMIAFGGER